MDLIVVDVGRSCMKVRGRRMDLIERNLAAPSIRILDNAKVRGHSGGRPKLGLKAGLRTVSNFLIEGDAKQ